MTAWAAALVVSLGSLVLAGQETDEDLAHYIKKEPHTEVPWTSNERRINKMIEEEILKFNYAPETTECPLDSQGKPKPTEGRQPTWWNAYRQAKEGDRPDWSAEIRELVAKGGGTYPPWTPSQESEPVLSKHKHIEPFTWRPGAPVINLRIKTDATTRPSSEPKEPTTERSIILQSCQWDTSEDGGGGGGKEPPLNLAPLHEGYKGINDYLKVKPRKKLRKVTLKPDRQSPFIKMSRAKEKSQKNSSPLRIEESKTENKMQNKLQLRWERARRTQHEAVNFARL